MIYLKNYKIFESNFKKDINDFEILIQDLEDYCLDFKDADLNVTIEPRSELHRNAIAMKIGAANDYPFFILVEKFNENKRITYFDWREFILTIESITSFMDENGFDATIELYNTTSNTHRSVPVDSTNITTRKNGNPGEEQFKLNRPYYKNIFKVMGFKLIFNYRNR